MTPLRVVPFEPWHWYQVEPQPGLIPFNPSPEYLNFYARQPWAITAIAADGRILMCAGIIQFWENRGECWCHLAAVCRQEFVALFRAMHRTLFRACPLRRIEATVEEKFEQGHRMMRLLGFEAEGLAKAYYPDGRAVMRYAHIREV